MPSDGGASGEDDAGGVVGAGEDRRKFVQLIKPLKQLVTGTNCGVPMASDGNQGLRWINAS